jgi:hypothetical protein
MKVTLEKEKRGVKKIKNQLDPTLVVSIIENGSGTLWCINWLMN